MACFHPISGFRTKCGKITLDRKQATSTTLVDIPCGQCSGCRLERARQWAVRCTHEASQHDANSFITLTYDDENLPADKSLNVRHWQAFAKTLRNKFGPFRYYHCGEYGGPSEADQPDNKGYRAHLHALLFGLDFHQDRYKWRKLGEHQYYRSPDLEACWTKGSAEIGDVTHDSAAYVAGYIRKKQTGKNQQAYYRNLAQHLTGDLDYIRVDDKTGECFDGLKPPYSTMSLKPGIGSTWLKRYKTDVFPHDFVITNGHQARPPAYYFNQLSDAEQLTVKARRAKNANLPRNYDERYCSEYITTQRTTQSSKRSFG